MLQQPIAPGMGYAGPRQTVDVGGMEAQVLAQWGDGYLVAVPADQPVMNSAWVTPVGTMAPGSMPAATPMAVCPSTNVASVASAAGVMPSSFAAHNGAQPAAAFPPAANMCRPQPPPPSHNSGDLPQNAKVFEYNSNGGLRPMASQRDAAVGDRSDSRNTPSRTNGSSSVVEKQVFTQHREAGPRPHLSQKKSMGPCPIEAPPAPPAAPAGAKIFVHDSDGVLHHVAKCSQGMGGVEVNVLNETSRGVLEGNDEARSKRYPNDMAEADYDGWRGSSVSFRDELHHSSPGGSDATSTTAESLPSPRPNGECGAGPGSVSSSADSSSGQPVPLVSTLGRNRYDRLKALVASGPPSGQAPLPPPPPPPPLPQEQFPQAGISAKTGQSGRKSGRSRKGKQLWADEDDEDAAPVLPSWAAPKADPAGLHRAAEEVLDQVHTTSPEERDTVENPTPASSSAVASPRVTPTIAGGAVGGETPASSSTVIQPRVRSQKQNNRSATQRQGRQDPHRNPAAGTEQRSQPQESAVGGKAAAATGAQPRRSRKADRDILKGSGQKGGLWASRREAFCEYLPRVALAASMVFLGFAVVLFFVVSMTAPEVATVTTREPASSIHNWASMSPRYGDRRVGPVQQRLDVESARALAAVRGQKTKRRKKGSSRHEKKESSSSTRDSARREKAMEDYARAYQTLLKDWEESRDSQAFGEDLHSVMDHYYGEVGEEYMHGVAEQDGVMR